MASNLNSLTAETERALMDIRAKIARIGAYLFDRRLTDAAGGNISARVGEYVCFSPRYAGSQRQWQLKPDDVLVVDFDGNVLDGNGDLSRETKVHLKLHREFGEHGTGVIHAHARNILVFAAHSKPMPMVLEGTRKFGEIPVSRYAPAHSAELAEYVAAEIRGQEARIRKQAAAVIAPWHGLFCMGKDLDAAFDAVERIDNNAYVILMGQLLTMSDSLAAQREAMEAACANFQS